MTRSEFIDKWRKDHKEGWHDQECCVNELLDELELLFTEEMQDAPRVRPAASNIKCFDCGMQAHFIINGKACCYEHYSLHGRK